MDSVTVKAKEVDVNDELHIDYIYRFFRIPMRAPKNATFHRLSVLRDCVII